MNFLVFSLFTSALSKIPVIGRPGMANGKVQTFPTTDTDRGYWVLAMHWPKTTCEIINENDGEDCMCEMGDSRLNEFNNWKIHGYWPVDIVGTGCIGNTHLLQANDTDMIDTQLLSQWPNLRNREKRGLKCDAYGADWLWEQSWCQHGAVKPKRFPSPYSYFQQTLEIAKRWRLHDLLKGEQIIPHEKNTYTLKQLNEALMKKAGILGAQQMGLKFFSVHCGCESTRRRESQKLWEIRICLDRSNTPVHASRCGLADCCDSHNAIFYPPRNSGPTRSKRAQLFDKNNLCRTNACSYKQITSIPGAMSPAVIRKQKEVPISPETNPGLIVGVSLGLVIGASFLAAVLYSKFHKDDTKKINENRRASDETNIMNRLYLQTGLMQFSQPEPSYLNHQIKGETNYPQHQLPTESNYPNHQLPTESNYPNHQLPVESNYPNHQIHAEGNYNSYQLPVETNYPQHQINASVNYAMHQLPQRRAIYATHQLPNSSYPVHRLPNETNYPIHVIPASVNAVTQSNYPPHILPQIRPGHISSPDAYQKQPIYDVVRTNQC